MDFHFTPEQEGLYTLQEHPVVRLRRHAKARATVRRDEPDPAPVIARRLLDEHASA